MDWTTLISVVIGGLIATIPVLVSNRFQAKERDEDRQEQRREAKTQLALELMRNNIKVIDDDIDDVLRTMIVATHASLSKYKGKLSDDEMREQLEAQILDRNNKIFQLGESHTNADKVAYSLGNEFYSEFKRFNELCLEYWDLVLNTDSVWDDRQKERESYLEIISSAAKLHNMLQDKLISIRDA